MISWISRPWKLADEAVVLVVDQVAQQAAVDVDGHQFLQLDVVFVVDHRLAQLLEPLRRASSRRITSLS
jgi:hypothetical protein